MFWGGGGIDVVGLLSETRHKIGLIMGEGLLVNEGVCPPFVDHFLHCLVEEMDPRLAIIIGQS
jgi:hypothetical protein